MHARLSRFITGRAAAPPRSAPARGKILAAGIIISSVILMTGTVEGSVLHDTLWITDNAQYTTKVSSAIAPMPPFGQVFDNNAADDFTVPTGPGYNITSVTGDFTSQSSFVGEGVLVEFFADMGGTPSATPTAATVATLGNGLSVTPFDDHLGGTFNVGMRLTVDLINAGIVLGSGTWWMSMVVVNENGPNQQYLWNKMDNYVEGNELHVRGGGEAHGNGYNNSWGTLDWTPHSDFGTNIPGDLAMRVEGNLIPGPGAMALLGIAGLFVHRRHR